MPRHPEPAMTVRDVATYLNVDEKTIYRLVQRGELPGFKVAGAWRFQLADIQRWIEERKHLPTGKETTKREQAVKRTNSRLAPSATEMTRQRSTGGKKT